jgi:hypothetical protein
MAKKKRKVTKVARAAARSNRAELPPTQLPRVARGKRPQYFSDPAIDKLLSMTLTLCEELSVTRDRLDTVERLLEHRKLVPRSAIESYVPDARSEAERDANRRAYVERVMHIVQAELAEVTNQAARATDEAVAAVDDLPR